jgi:hypothetical protein
MRTFIIFIVISIVLSMLRRNRAGGMGPPVAKPRGLGDLLRPEPAPPTAAPKRAPAARPSRKTITRPAAKPTARSIAKADARRRGALERVEDFRDQARRRAETDAANTAAESAVGERTAVPGGIDPRLLERDRTPQPTPEPLHPR